MFKKRFSLLFFFLSLVFFGRSQEQPAFTEIHLNNLNAFEKPGDNWQLASNVTASLDKEGELNLVQGIGVLVNKVSSKNRTHLITNEKFGDVEIELDFMMAKGSNSGVYLQGRYEVQLYDSWTKQKPGFTDCGGIYQRWDDTKNQGFEGTAPLVNVARAPGLWQHLQIRFRAPRFNSKGVKIENARFESVYLNGVLVQQQIAVTGPTRASLSNQEVAIGPLMIQGDHGNLAVRNIKYKLIGGENSSPEKINIANPILIDPDGRPYLLRSFLSYGDRMITHAISVGHPNQVNYSYDLKRGALLQIWRGRFANATDLWLSRGEPYQRIVPLGSVIQLSDAPSLAILPNKMETPWPDSISFDEVKTEGYVLDARRAPSYQYNIYGSAINDKIFSSGSNGIEREIIGNDLPVNLYHRIAVAKKIEKIKKGWYAIADKTFYISIDEKLHPFVRQTNGEWELVVPVEKPNVPVSYSIIW